MNDTQKIKWLKAYYKANKLPLNEVNLFGIRDSADLAKDVINDQIGYFTDSDILIARGTTEPGVYWTKTEGERNKAGTFHLKEGFHERIWCVGTHKGYEALVNDYRYCKPTKGWRDANYDFVRDSKDVEVCDYFGINCHRMHPIALVDKVGKYSAGCQVYRDPNDFKKLLATIKASHMYRGTSAKTVFNYMLFTIDEIPSDFKS